MKLLIVRGREPSSWFSVRVILQNLEACYRGLGAEFECRFVYLECDPGPAQAAAYLELIHQVKEWKPDKLVFIDNMPHPLEALRVLKQCLVFLPEMVFHLYGNFTLEAERWLALNALLTDRKIRFITASDRQSNLVGSMTVVGKPTSVLPFPVDASQFCWRPELRQLGRKKLGFSHDDKIQLYSGRLHVQKGVDHLIEIFTSLAGLQPDLHFVIAGDYDDTPSKVLNLSTPLGYYFNKMRRQLERLPEATRRKIHLLGNVEHKDLPELYCAADSFVSLSLYHDDDYGMAMAEAGACGTPMLLSNWAGLSSFACAGDVRLVQVALDKQGLVLNLSDAEAKLQQLLEVDLSEGDRERSSRRFLQNFSIEAVTDRLSQLLNEDSPIFEGFNSRLGKLAKQVAHHTLGLPRSGGIYGQIYSNYLAEGPGT